MVLGRPLSEFSRHNVLLTEPNNVLNEISVLVSCASLAATVRGLRVSGQSGSELLALLKSKLRIKALDVDQALAEIAEAGRYGKVDAEALSRVFSKCNALTGSAVTTSFVAIVAAQMERGLSELRRICSSLRASGTDEMAIDSLMALAVSQQAQDSISLCLNAIPLSEIFVPPLLRVNRNGQAVRYSDAAPPTSRVVAVRAPFGHGKSTLLRLVALRHIEIGPLVGSDARVPIYLTASDLLEHSGHFYSRVAVYLNAKYGIDCGFLTRAHTSGQVVVLIDGWDEIPSLPVARDLLGSVVKAAARSTSRAVQVVLGGRDRFFSDASVAAMLESQEVWDIEVLGFDEPLRRQWIAQWNAYAVKAKLPVVNGSDEKFLDMCRVDAIFETPLILLLYALLSSPDGAILRSQAALYGELISATVEGKAIVPLAANLPFRGLVDRESLPIAQGLAREKRRVLQVAAVAALDHGGRSVPRSVLMQRIEAECGAEVAAIQEFLGRSDMQLEDWFASLELAHFFQQGGGALTFLYQSFVEYLAAEFYYAISRYVDIPRECARWVLDIASLDGKVLPRLVENQLSRLYEIHGANEAAQELPLLRAMMHHIADGEIMGLLEWLDSIKFSPELRKQLVARYMMRLSICDVSWGRAEFAMLGISRIRDMRFASVAFKDVGQLTLHGCKLEDCRVHGVVEDLRLVECTWVGGEVMVHRGSIGMKACRVEAVDFCEATFMDATWEDVVFEVCNFRAVNAKAVNIKDVKLDRCSIMGSLRLRASAGPLAFRGCQAYGISKIMLGDDRCRPSGVEWVLDEEEVEAEEDPRRWGED